MPLQVALSRIGMGCAVLGAALTLFLVLRTEPPFIAYRHLAGIGWTVLFVMAPLVALLLWMSISTHSLNSSPSSISMLGAIVLGLSLFLFVPVSIFFCFIHLCGRLKEPTGTIA